MTRRLKAWPFQIGNIDRDALVLVRGRQKSRSSMRSRLSLASWLPVRASYLMPALARRSHRYLHALDRDAQCITRSYIEAPGSSLQWPCIILHSAVVSKDDLCAECSSVNEIPRRQDVGLAHPRSPCCGWKAPCLNCHWTYSDPPRQLSVKRTDDSCQTVLRLQHRY